MDNGFTYIELLSSSNTSFPIIGWSSMASQLLFTSASTGTIELTPILLRLRLHLQVRGESQFFLQPRILNSLIVGDCRSRFLLLLLSRPNLSFFFLDRRDVKTQNIFYLYITRACIQLLDFTRLTK